MNRNMFINELQERLKGIPPNESADAIAYYEEYFDEAGPQYEAKALMELGSPSEVASKIIGNYAIKDIESSPKSANKGLKTIWLVILAIFASPIALPIAITVVVLIFTFVIVAVSLVFAFGVAGVSVLGSGVVIAFSSIFIMMKDFASAIFFIGSGFLCIGIGGFLCLLTKFIYKVSFGVIAKMIGKFLLRRSAR